VVEHHTIELPDGRLIPEWPWIITPDYVNAVAVTEDGRFICFRQVKYGLEGETLGIVGGFVEEGEDPFVAARRELLEETGYESADWIPLGTYRVDPTAASPWDIYIWLATRATSLRGMRTISKSRKSFSLRVMKLNRR
jgi:8-oxo-dGTP pyrophosphatase MutT (NUDIX family)